MAFKLRGSHLIAAAITAAIGGWMVTGELIIGGKAGSAGAAKPIVEREAARSRAVFKVRVKTLQPQQRTAQLLIRGRTQADATISVRAETGGTLQQRMVDKGAHVKPGDLLCIIDQGIRKSNLNQAKALLAQAEADYEAKDELVKKGYSAKTTLRAAKAAMDAATASIEAVKQDLARTEVRASVAGEVTGPMAEAGDNLSPGSLCVTLIDNDPMLFIGQVSERDISRIEVGHKTGVRVVTGEEMIGKITYIAPNADPKTRTFRVEIAMDNSNGKLRDGVTATSVVQLEPTMAFKVKPSWLTLADNGDIGLRGVGSDNKVLFIPVKILSQAKDGMWVSGIEPGTSIITLGHEYVVAGEIVEPVADMKTGDAKATLEQSPAKSPAKSMQAASASQ